MRTKRVSARERPLSKLSVAARTVDGRVILYADIMTDSSNMQMMKQTDDEKNSKHTMLQNKHYTGKRKRNLRYLRKRILAGHFHG